MLNYPIDSIDLTINTCAKTFGSNCKQLCVMSKSCADLN